MRHEIELHTMTQQELAELGTDHVAYMREISSEDVVALFPEAPDVPKDTKFWVLFAADGSPLMLADDQNAVFADAYEHDLMPVSIH